MSAPGSRRRSAQAPSVTPFGREMDPSLRGPDAGPDPDRPQAAPLPAAGNPLAGPAQAPSRRRAGARHDREECPGWWRYRPRMGTVGRCERRRPGGAGRRVRRPRRDGERGVLVSSRRCSRTGCKRPALYTLTYVYRESTAVLGPLAAYTEPHCYDLCEAHAGRLTAPLGWDVVRLPGDPAAQQIDDLEALANAVREAAIPVIPAGEPVGQGTEVGRRGHLRVLRSDPKDTGSRG